MIEFINLHFKNLNLNLKKNIMYMKNYILRKIKGKSHIFLDKNVTLLKIKNILKKCLEGVYIVAYDNVRINLNKKAKVLAIGYDVKIDLNIFIIKSLLKK